MRLRAQSGRFFEKKLRKKLLQKGTFRPSEVRQKTLAQLPQNAGSSAIQVIFRGILFAREKNTPGPRELREKESSLSFSRSSLGLAEKLKLLRQK
jgi:hypothetical protein